MADLRSRIADISKGKRIKATVVEILNGYCTVSTGGKLYKGLSVIGGPVTVGQSVFLDFGSGTPIIQAYGTESSSLSGSSTTTIVARILGDTEIVDPNTGLEPSAHTHTESQITDLSYNALKIRGYPIDALTVDDNDKFLQFSYTNSKFVLTTAAAGSSVGAGAKGETTWQIEGALAIATQVGQTLIITSPGTIEHIYAYVETLGSSGSTIIDVNKNGTSLYTTQANRPTIAFDDSDHVVSTTPDVTSVTTNDIITLDIDEVAIDASTLTVVISMGRADITTLSGLSDVVIDGNQTGGQAIVWDANTSKWIPGTVAGESPTAEIPSAIKTLFNTNFR